MLILYLLFFFIQAHSSSNEKTTLEETNEMLKKENNLYYDPKDQNCIELIKEKFGIDSPVYKLLCIDLDKINIEGKKENANSIKEVIKTFREDQTSARLKMEFILNNKIAENTMATIFNKLFQDKGHFNEHDGLLWYFGKVHSSINPIIDYQLIPIMYSFKLQSTADLYNVLEDIDARIEKLTKKLRDNFHNKEMPLIFKNFREQELPKIKENVDQHLVKVTFPKIAEVIDKQLKEKTLPIIENKFNAIWKEKIIIIDEKIDTLRKDIKTTLHYSLSASKSLSKLIIFYVALYAICKKLYYDINILYEEYILPEKKNKKVTDHKNTNLSIFQKHGMKLVHFLIGITLSYITYEENKIFTNTIQKILS